MATSIALFYAPSMRVGGEVLQGEVELRFPQIIEDGVEEVHVKLRGKVFAKVARQFGQTYVVRTESIEVARETVPLWTKGSAYPPTGLQVLRIPFTLQLPLNVQPSCQYSGAYKKGNVGYFVEVVGVRPGFLSLNRRAMRPFAVVPNDPAGLALRTSLQAGWTGARNTIRRTDSIRRGIWGGYADVKLELTMPSIGIFPLFTKIPFTLRVITTSKEMKYDEKDENQEVFPEPPRFPKEVAFLLRREVFLNPHGWRASDSETISHLGGMGKSAPPTGNGNVVVAFEKKWSPSEKNKNVGTWKQEVTMESAFELNTTPSFATPILRQRNYLRIKVGFPGIGNNLEADIPIEVTSGLVTPSPEAEAPPYDGPPGPLDLPPTYWAGTDWDTSDEKVDPFGSDKK